MQVFPQHFISFLAVYMYTTGGMRAGDPDVAMSYPKAQTFAPFEGTSNPKVGTMHQSTPSSISMSIVCLCRRS